MNNIEASLSIKSTIFFLMILVFTRPIISKDFLQCMATRYSTTIVYTRDSTLYPSVFQKSQQNPRWLNSSLAFKPLYIVTPSQEPEIGAAILCSREHGFQVRVRSGGHDYEGLSYLSRTPFVLIDLIHLRMITFNTEDQTAWVQCGATLGELYYNIAQRNNTYGFPAGVCPTVGVGGHISGGGFGTLTRKYGLAADHVVDARLVDANGQVLDRKLMGEEVFWAIRGGGGASFGVITAWKIKLVLVPVTVTVFTVHKSLEQGANKLIDKWQWIAYKLPEDLFIRVIVQNIGGNYGVKKTIQASFNSMFLGNIQSLIPLMKHSFPELELEEKDCKEMSWIEAVLYFAGHPSDTPKEVLLDRDHQLYKSYFKAKSDFINQPIPEIAFQQAWERHLQVNEAYMVMEPLGGIMSRIPETQIAFPHRGGNLYNIQYIVKWKVNEAEEAKRHIHWMRMLYKFMSPYVSNSPRTAYFNYRDLDLGINGIHGTTSYVEAGDWGTKYFKNNFERLAKAKRSIDPSNFFRDEQSIPPFG
ncbi:berberine bridge enzyme-like 22 [Beta vulgaris subsp. vulgaris]|uniref:berberine bridge enzyme-like 22 n=1 Tax=Beta vulgaris subsp. vulgaris TaxID=3555 RepID=UPI002037363A|nr:berberine bridge enzyme-like 22 [Beta vulgaris subsp. vulgaris]